MQVCLFVAFLDENVFGGPSALGEFPRSETGRLFPSRILGYTVAVQYKKGVVYERYVGSV